MPKIQNTQDFNYRFGQNLARLRNLNGLTHTDMESYGISRSYYGKVELGIYSVSIEKIVLIAKAFGVPVHKLFLDENNEPI